MFGCKHDWTVQARTVATANAVANIRGYGENVIPAWERAMHGFSEVLLTCGKCGKIEKRVLLGEVDGSTQGRPVAR